MASKLIMLPNMRCTKIENQTLCTGGSPNTKLAACPLWSTSHAVTAVFPPRQGEALRELTRQRPDLHGFVRSRWRLCDLRDALPFFEKYSLPGMCLALQRLKLKRKQGRVHVHNARSPDPFYLVKMRWIEQAWELAKRYPQQVSLLYGDELSFYRRPTLTGGGTFYPQGEEPTFEQVAGYNTRHRVGATMDHGRLHRESGVGR